jgi:hypothetical protein
MQKKGDKNEHRGNGKERAERSKTAEGVGGGAQSLKTKK